MRDTTEVPPAPLLSDLLFADLMRFACEAVVIAF